MNKNKLEEKSKYILDCNALIKELPEDLNLLFKIQTMSSNQLYKTIGDSLEDNPKHQLIGTSNGDLLKDEEVGYKYLGNNCNERMAINKGYRNLEDIDNNSCKYKPCEECDCCQYFYCGEKIEEVENVKEK